MAHQEHIDWVEVITDQYIGRPAALRGLARMRETFPIVPHGVEMSIGSDAPLDQDYLDEVARVVGAVDAPWASDHLCFTRDGAIDLDTFMPVWRTRQKARSIAAKAQRVQDRIGRPFLLENIAYYFELPADLSEAELITEILEHCDCGLLLDLNNVAVNAHNFGFDPRGFLDALPLDRVVQVHLAGNRLRPELGGTHLDAHDAPVGDDVFDLLAYLVARHPLKGLIIERDANLPDDFGEFLVDLSRARKIVADTRAPR